MIFVGNGVIDFAVYKSNHKLRDPAQWVEHTEEVILLSGNILAAGCDDYLPKPLKRDELIAIIQKHLGSLN